VSSRFSRIAKSIGINPLLACGRKPRIIPMSSNEQRIQDELHRRREAARLAREARHPGPHS
jgi:hypothetical protein